MNFCLASSWAQLAGHAGEARFRASVAVALVVFDQAAAQCIVGCFLQVARYRGGDAEAFGVGIAAIAADHFGAGHLGDVGAFTSGVGTW